MPALRPPEKENHTCKVVSDSLNVNGDIVEQSCCKGMNCSDTF